MTADPLDPTDWPVRNMAVIVRRHLRNLAKVLRPYGMTPQMMRVLNFLAEVGEENIGAIADQSAYERSYVSRVIDRMVADGYLERAPVATDKRYTLVRLTDYGYSRWEEVIPAVRTLMEHTVSGLSPDELGAFVSAIRTVERNVNNADAAMIKPPRTAARRAAS
ncbi:MAG: MarR family transcriptional regulator [Bauldia litoralis]